MDRKPIRAGSLDRIDLDSVSSLISSHDFLRDSFPLDSQDSQRRQDNALRQRVHHRDYFEPVEPLVIMRSGRGSTEDGFNDSLLDNVDLE